MKKEILVWQIIVFILGLVSILTIREHLQDKNKINAEIGKANCIVEMAKTFPNEERFAVYSDIKTYKIKDFIK
jgi:hypothetical protein